MSKQTISAKDYLSRAYRIDQRINSKLEQLISLRSLAEKAAPVLTGMPSGKRSKIGITLICKHYPL